MGKKLEMFDKIGLRLLATTAAAVGLYVILSIVQCSKTGDVIDFCYTYQEGAGVALWGHHKIGQDFKLGLFPDAMRAIDAAKSMGCPIGRSRP